MWNVYIQYHAIEMSQKCVWAFLITLLLTYNISATIDKAVEINRYDKKGEEASLNGNQ